MCGITGFWKPTNFIDSNAQLIATKMADCIAHRGPNDSGIYVDKEAGIVLAHRRLSILDLSMAGHQPMHSISGRYVMAFNGEIYNHLDLRRELNNNIYISTHAKDKWRGHSDTETLLMCFEIFGIEETLKKCIGMFAISLWDRENLTLHLIRDRMGEKPLYYGWVGAGDGAAFVFGSELKSLRAYPSFNNAISREALALYMRFTYVPAPHSIYKNIFKLEPGSILSIKGDDSKVALINAPERLMRPPEKHGGLALKRWWSLSNLIETSASRVIKDRVEGVDLLEQKLKDAIHLQAIADVPLGAFLSGGIDSSTIVSLMQLQSMRAVKTFTIGFEEAGFDESPHALAVANYLGTDHTEVFVTAFEAQEVIPQLSNVYDEPFADSSQIPTFIVSKIAHQQVSVALSGDGGDELFGGYNRYLWGTRIWNQLSLLPHPFRQALASTIRAVPLPAWNTFDYFLKMMLSNDRKFFDSGEKFNKLANRLGGVRNLDDLYKSLVSEWSDPSLIVKGEHGKLIIEPESLISDSVPHQIKDQQQLLMMFRDSMTYLPDDILCKVDRAAMANSLETRVPFLDHRVVEVAWRLPLNMKIYNNQGKWALRQVLYKYVPPELIDRPKAGFGVPLGAWLRGPLRDWAESLLCKQRLEKEGYFYAHPICKKWDEHKSGRRDHTNSLWTILMFQSWLEEIS